MGREVRRVPKDWKHPSKDGAFIPLLGARFSERAREWDEEAAQWAKGLRRDYIHGGWVKLSDEMKERTYEDWEGARPRPEDFMPEWSETEATHFMMYEDTSEGTPISPAFETPEQLARWLADTRASAFGPSTASYEAWLAMIKSGIGTVGMAVVPGRGMVNGVELMGLEKDES